ncbi:MAG: M20/M25/M40 family metallo-hydrolase, partial [Acidobacteriota bacterium]
MMGSRRRHTREVRQGAAPMSRLDPIELTRRLIEVPSPTGAEGEIGRFLVPVLEEIGLAVTVQPVGPDRFNLLAVASEAPEVTLCTHIDVVPPHLPLREDETHLYGRGACDTKGILAAMLAAAADLVDAGVDHFGLLLVVGEEVDSAGARAANERADGSSRFIVVGEPTGSRFARGQKGAFKADLTVQGRAAHSAYPERGESAVLKMLPVLDDLLAADWGTHDVYGPGTFNIGELHAGVRANIIPGEAVASVLVRVVDSAAETQARLAALVAGRAEMRVTHANDPQELYVPPGSDETVVAFNTDIPSLPCFGTPLLFGPGSILDAHGAGEKITKADILEAVVT